jgi:hypothetical protein
MIGPMLQMMELASFATRVGTAECMGPRLSFGVMRMWCAALVAISRAARGSENNLQGKAFRRRFPEKGAQRKAPRERPPRKLTENALREKP